MRALVATLTLAALAVAGCVTPPPSTNTSASSATSGWTLDCALGSFEHSANASWGQSCEARASHNAGPKEETWIAVNPTDPLNVVVGAKDLDPAASKGCVWNGVFVTHDGGKSWRDVHIGGTYASRDPTSPYYGYACNTDPDFQFTRDGALHYGVEMYGFLSQNAEGVLPQGTPQNGFTSSGYKILLATSHDGGDTWPDVITYQPDLVITTDFSRMTIDPVTQAILEAIGSDGGGGCHVLVSRDGGKTADPPADVQTPYGAPCNSGGESAVAVSPKGVVVLVGGEASSPTDITGSSSDTVRPIVVRSTDDGRTWIDSNVGFARKPLKNFNESKYRITSVVELAYDLTNGANKGLLYAAYPSMDRDGGDIYVRTSKDDGKTWSDPVMVNDDPAGAHQWMANVAVAGDGSAHVFYMDKRYDPAHKLIDITHAVSTDGGKTWANERVSTISYDGDLGRHQEGFPFIGDYLGVACGVSDCWAGFPDASNGQTTVIAAAHVHKA